MKKFIVLELFLVIIGSIVITSCNLFNTVSIEERIDQFVSDCNSSDKSEMYLNLHPTETTMRSQMMDPSTWSDFPDSKQPWSITEVSRSGTTEVTMAAQIDNNAISPESITIVFKEGDPDVWYIKSLNWPDQSLNIY